MCCDNSGADRYHQFGGRFVSLINGECRVCGEDTVDGETTDHCNYSPLICEECGWAPCDESC